MRLIDADALPFEPYGEDVISWYATGWNDAINVINRAPTVDAEPVRHGEWLSTALVDQKGRVIVEQYKCSLCGRQEYQKEPYCHCGAKMDGGKQDA